MKNVLFISLLFFCVGFEVYIPALLYFRKSECEATENQTIKCTISSDYLFRKACKVKTKHDKKYILEFDKEFVYDMELYVYVFIKKKTQDLICEEFKKIS